MIVSAGNMETFAFALPVGIGMNEAAVNTTKAVLLDPPKELVFIGSAGSYGGHEIFDIVTSAKGCSVEACFFQKKCYTPMDNVIDAGLEGDVMVNSSNYITADEANARQFLKRGIAIENMEFYSILQVAKEFELPVKGIFVITNHCFQDAHKQFAANHKEAMAHLTRHLQKNYAVQE